MDPHEVLAQATAIAQTVIVVTPTPTAATPPASTIFPSEFGYFVSAIMGGLVSIVAGKIQTGWNTNAARRLAEEQAEKQREDREDERNRAWKHGIDESITEMRREVEQRANTLSREAEQNVNAINIALLKVERSVAEHEKFIEPLRLVAQVAIQKRLQSDSTGNS